jgi:hypothetical protein
LDRHSFVKLAIAALMPPAPAARIGQRFACLILIDD